jgi:tRNA nucleotidyltransferase (CCA-adding enzyme)
VTAPARAGRRSKARGERLRQHPIPGSFLSALLPLAARRAAELGTRLALVGGVVRDLLLARELVDVDLAVEGAPEKTLALAAALAHDLEGAVGARHERFGTATIETQAGTRVDLATTRRESYPVPGALPVIDGEATLEEDLARRDFTVHAMASRVEESGALGDVLDPFGGRADLEARRLRLIHARSLADDPTRVLRAARYAARLAFAWDAGFPPALAESRKASSWKNISGDRLRRCLEEVLAENEREEAFALLRASGVLDDVVPGWGGAPPAPLAAAGALEDRWAALLSPLPPALRGAIAERLNFSRALRRATDMR